MHLHAPIFCSQIVLQDLFALCLDDVIDPAMSQINQRNGILAALVNLVLINAEHTWERVVDLLFDKLLGGAVQLVFYGAFTHTIALSDALVGLPLNASFKHKLIAALIAALVFTQSDLFTPHHVSLASIPAPVTLDLNANVTQSFFMIGQKSIAVTETMQVVVFALTMRALNIR